MVSQKLVKLDRRKSLLCLSLIVLGLTALMGSSCDTKQSVPAARPAVAKKKKLQSPQTATDFHLVGDSICRGDFERAQQILEQMPAKPGAGQMKYLVDHYFEIERLREQKRETAFREQLQELEEIKEKVPGNGTPDVNDIDETMVALIRAREYALQEQKAELMNDPFVQMILRQMRVNANSDEQQGKWLDAYTHYYLWLSELYEDDKIYKDKTKELTELAAIELAMKDSTCGETVIERYKGIKIEMFLRALQLLNSNYVNTIDYREMTQEALNRCRLIGTVLEKTNEQLAWSASKEQVSGWNTALDALEARAQALPQGAEAVEVKTVAEFLEDVLVMNAETLKIPEEVIIAHYTEAALESLDPFTNLVWPWNVKDFEKSMTQQFTGIGVEISKRTGVLKVVSLLPDTPAYTSGLDAEDEIIKVNGEPTKDMTIYCAISKITGPKGTNVLLTIRRPSTGETKDITITRDKIVVQPLRGWMRNENGGWNYWVDPENRIGYVRLTAFTESSGPDLDEVLRKLEKKGMKGLILDLRFNSGGYLQASAEVVDLFVKEGFIVKSNPKQGLATYEIAHRSGTHPDYPLVVLINNYSASASEIVAGALQDFEHQRATLVGQRSYGKGSVQVVTGFTGDGSQLKYTIAYYHLPSDQQVKNRYQMEKLGRDDWGIAPDVEVEMLSNEMKEMIDIQRSNDVLARTDHETNGGSTNRHTLQETLQADPQLSIGLLVLRSKLVAQGQVLALDPVVAENSSAKSIQNDMQ
ncbi:MAG: S41 family peptidase [Planctomycetota bacterium]|jgi:carboxyl-terminal processing protease